MPLKERFELAGQVLESQPPGGAFKFKPVRAETEDTYTDGSGALMSAPQQSHTVITVKPRDTFLVTLETKLAWEAARDSGALVDLIETHSDPSQTTHWSVIVREAECEEVEGSERQYYTYALTLYAGVL